MRPRICSFILHTTYLELFIRDFVSAIGGGKDSFTTHKSIGVGLGNPGDNLSYVTWCVDTATCIIMKNQMSKY